MLNRIRNCGPRTGIPDELLNIDKEDSELGQRMM
jgi:hypothetical protein